MKLRQIVVLALVVLAVDACRRREPPPQAPAPTTTESDADRLARARADSIAQAERLRQEGEARARAAELAGVRESLTEMIFFEYDSDQLTSAAEDRIRAKAAIMRSNPTLRIRIEGHADERGSTEYNLALGQRRAEGVKNFLTGYGLDAGRISTVSYGEEQPAVQGSNESAWARNRRAEFEMTAGQISSVPSEVR